MSARRGYPAPEQLPERLRDQFDRHIVVRLTDWEMDHLRHEEGGAKVALVYDKPSRTYELLWMGES